MSRNATSDSAPLRLVSVSKGAEYLGVHPMTLRRYIAAGRVAAYHVGPRLIKVNLDELDAFIRPVDPAN